MTMKLHEFLQLHESQSPIDDLRLGQRFINTFIRGTWPELFYQEDDARSLKMIQDWLEAYQYFDGDLPVPLRSNHAA